MAMAGCKMAPRRSAVLLFCGVGLFFFSSGQRLRFLFRLGLQSLGFVVGFSGGGGFPKAASLSELPPSGFGFRPRL